MAEAAERPTPELDLRLSEPVHPGVMIDVNDDEFDRMSNSYPFFVLNCWAPWSIPCKMMDPVLEEMAYRYKESIIFGRLNIEENVQTARKLGVISTPTLLVFRNGILVRRLIGMKSPEAIEREILSGLGEVG